MENDKNILFKNKIIEITNKSIHFKNKIGFFKKGIEDTVLINSVQSISIFKYKNYGVALESVGKLFASIFLAVTMSVVGIVIQEGIFIFVAAMFFIFTIMVIIMIIKSIIGYDAISLTINGEEKIIVGSREETESAYHFIQDKIFN